MQLRDRKKLKRANDPNEEDADFEVIDLERVVVNKSVKYLVEGKRSDYPGLKIPFPVPLNKKSKELQKLRAVDVWKKGTREDQLVEMQKWFPDVPQESPFEEDLEDVQMQDASTPSAPRARARERDCPSSDIGRFSKLPGELRNRIYRLAMLQPPEDMGKPAKFEMETGTCSQGTCLHGKLSYNVPGIANTCRQLRWEAMPIFCVENKAFQFDDGMVHQCCVGNFLRSIGDYADLIPEFQFLLLRPIWNNDQFQHNATYTFTLTPPKIAETEDGAVDKTTEQWSLVQHEEQDRKVCQCALDAMIAKMNGRVGKMPTGKEVVEFVDSEEFADYVWRMRKSKQWPQFLKRCKACKEVLFNN